MAFPTRFPTRFPRDSNRTALMDVMRRRLLRQYCSVAFPVLLGGDVRFPVRKHRWGYQSNAAPSWSRLADAYAALAVVVANHKKGEASDGDLVEALQEAGDYALDATTRKLIAHINAAVGEHIVVYTECGHIVEATDVVHDHAGTTYCQECADESLREPVDGNGLYHTDDLYYWETDGEYHRHEYQEEEEDEYEYEESSSNRSEDHDSLYRWGASTSDLAHDMALQDAASKFGSFPIGVELEVESDEDDLDGAIANTRRHFGGTESSYAMLKTDGSLGEHGFEIVTAARGLSDHISRFESWRPHSSLTAWSNGRCGVHVHIDSRAFTSLTLGKFINFINDRDNATFIKSIAGRHPRDGGNAADYCAQLSQPMGARPTVHLKKNGTSHTSRYRMVNVTNLSYREMERLGIDARRDCKGNYSTVELRIFRASLKKERLLAQIEFAHAAVLFCRTAAWHQLTGDAFTAWLRTGDAAQYKHLRRWFGINLPKANKKSTVVRSTSEV